MRLLHTADLHLGRALRGAARLDDQAAAMDALVAAAQEARPDLLVVAGDVFDAFTPSRAALDLLDETLARIVRGIGVRTLLLAGNHDDPHRLGFGARLLEAGGLAVAARPGWTRVPAGDGEVIALPWADPWAVQAALGLADPPAGHDAAVAALLADVPAPRGPRALAAHLFVQGGRPSGAESERPTAVGTLECVQPETLAAAKAQAILLGHLHAPHAPCPGAWYAGAPIALSFDEAGQRKSIALLEISPDGTVRREEIPLAAGRPVRRIRGTFADLLTQAGTDPLRHAWTLVELEDPVRPLGAFERLQAAYSHLLGVTAADAAPVPLSPAAAGPTGRMDPLALFACFHETHAGAPLSDARRAQVAAALAEEGP
jgi:exonuclease SbcD